MGKLANKVAVVTGASKGIGAAVAKHLAAEGASVVVNYATSKEGGDKVVADIKAAGGQAIAVGANLAEERGIDFLFDETRKAFGRVDILVNNAGIYSFAPLEGITSDFYRRIYDINVLGVVLATQKAVALFPAEGGAVVNISSVVSSLAPPQASIYASSKGAIDVITRSLAKELAPRKIRVNAINPGYILTEGVHTTGIAGSELETGLIAITPLARAGQPEEVALPVVFLASDDARYITGETILVSGGAGI